MYPVCQKYIATLLAFFVVCLGGDAYGQQTAQSAAGEDSVDRAAAAFSDVPGCLGARSLERDGTQVSFVWFEDRDAVIAWCHSEKHMATAQAIMNLADPKLKMREPMSTVSDEDGPLLVIMSLKRSERQQGFPLQQLSMEIYKPVSGGMFIGAKFAPRELVVEGMREIRPK